MSIRAAIFDLDGLLIDSERLWQEAEVELFATVGHPLTHRDCTRTRGLRIDEAVRYWYAIRAWEEPSCEELATRITERVCELLLERGRALPGAVQAVELARRAGLKVAVASSSREVLIRAAIERLGIHLDAVHSAEHEPYGKPHPAVLLSTAASLRVDPTTCVVLEDSLNGLVAAKAARMRCVLVPDREDPPDPRSSLADVTLESLEELELAHLVGA